MQLLIDKTEDQELEPGNLEDDVVLKDRIQAAAWCQLQSFKDSVSLPEVIGMEVEPNVGLSAENGPVTTSECARTSGTDVRMTEPATARTERGAHGASPVIGGRSGFSL
ncbi:unnamed protein product [Boreogadus saida]